MKPLNVMQKTGLVFAGTLAAVSSASADILTDVQNSLGSAGSDALTAGGYVIAAVAGLVVISLIMKMIHKV